jgi:hypothetical protein
MVNRCRIQLNGQDRFDERYGDYFWKVQPYQHHTGGAFWLTKNSQSLANALSVRGTPTAISASFTLTAVGPTTSHPYTGLTGLLVPGMVLSGANATGFSIIITGVAPSSATAGTLTTSSFESTATTYTAGYSTSGSQNLAAASEITSTGTLTLPQAYAKVQEEIDNADQPLDPEEDATAFLTDKLLLGREYRAASIAFSSGHAPQPVLTHCIYLFQVDAAGAWTSVQGPIVSTSVDVQFPRPTSGKCPVFAVKVSLASTATFTPGTTLLSASNVTDTYYDLSIRPISLKY